MGYGKAIEGSFLLLVGAVGKNKMINFSGLFWGQCAGKE